MAKVKEKNQVEQVESTQQGRVLPPMPPKRRRRFGDRYDGYRIRNLDLPFHLIPNIMRSRLDSQIFFEETIDITELERYVRAKRAEIPNLRLMHVILAAAVRMFALRPRLNRFVAGKKIYARNTLRVSMTVKRSLTDDGEEAEVLPVFSPYDTLADVVERFNREWQAVVSEETKDENITDNALRLLSYIPTSFKTFVVWLVRNLDKVGWMPKAVYRASPFHSSFYITDIGSLGIDAVYHHLYEFGTTSCFIAMGKKNTERYIDDQGQVQKRKTMTIRFVLDERICDGHYYASSIRQFGRYMKHPELLEVPPEKIPEDM